MKLLEERIRTHGKIREGGVLKVDSFLNHQMDVKLFQEMGKEFLRLFGNCGVTKILTIEASGIGIACVTAQFFDCPVIFAKKNKTRNIAGDVYTSKVESFTHGKVYDIIVSKEFLHPEDRVLLIDDFLANGSALQGLINLVQDAGATLVGAGICVEKAFQPGGALIRGKGVRVESLARIESMDEEDGITYLIEMNTATAAEKGLASGDTVRLTSTPGYTVEGRLVVTEGIHPECVSSVVGTWDAKSKYLTIAQGKGVNLVTLIPGQDPKRMDHIVSAFDQLIRVKVEKVS